MKRQKTLMYLSLIGAVTIILASILSMSEIRPTIKGLNNINSSFISIAVLSKVIFCIQLGIAFNMIYMLIKGKSKSVDDFPDKQLAMSVFTIYSLDLISDGGSLLILIACVYNLIIFYYSYRYKIQKD